MRECAICSYLRLESRDASGTVGVNTRISELIVGAGERLDAGHDALAHILVDVCSEHVVDIYRGRLAGVSMAWRFAATGA